MAKPTIQIHDVENDSLIEREMNDTEYKQFLKDKTEIEAEKSEIEKKKLARESALAKLAALGLTEDEIAAL